MAVLVAEIVNLDDMRVLAQPAHGLRLAQYPLTSDLVQPFGFDKSESHIAVDECVVDQIDLFLTPSPRNSLTM